MKIINKPISEAFANNLDKDILDIIKAKETTTNYVKQGKCSKSSGFNLLKAYNDPNTKEIKLYLGHLKPSNGVVEIPTKTIAHMWIEVDGTTYATNEPKGFDRVVADVLTIDKTKYLYSQVESFLKPHMLQEALVESNNYGYHAGDLGKSEYYGVQSSGRGTGHFGTGTYFVGNPEKIRGYNDYQYGKGEAPHHIVDFSSYKLYKPSTNKKGYALHDALKVLDGSYTRWKDKVDDIETVNKYSSKDKYRYDTFTAQQLEELVGALNRLDTEDDPINYEYVSNFLVPNNFDKYCDELLLADLEIDDAYDEQSNLMEQLYDKVQEWSSSRVMDNIRDIRNIESKLYQALEGRVPMSKIKQGLEAVENADKQYRANRDRKVDSLATVFMKSLGYEGIDTRHLNTSDHEEGLAGLDNTAYGSVIYDVRPETIVESYEGKTFTLPKELVDKCIDYYKETYPTIKVEKLPIQQLVDDNDLLNDEDLQSYHQKQWDNKGAKEFSINQDKINSMRVSEVPFVIKKKDKLELVDGRHRTRALYNDGYDYVELPVVEEGLEEHLGSNVKLEESTQEVDSEGNPLTQEQINFFKDSKVRDSRGRLLVCYHGTDAEFDTFKKEFMGTNPRFKLQGGGYSGASEGFFFTNDPWYASKVGKNVKKCYLNITNPLTVKDFGWGSAVGQLDRRKGDIYRWVGDGHNDGIIVTETDIELLNPNDLNDDTVYGLDTVFVAFEPNQIKSIDNKNPSSSDNINEVLEEDSTVKVENLTEGKQDIENFRKWIETTEDSPARYMSGGNKDAYVNNFVNAFNEERKSLKAPYNDYYYWIKQNDWNAFTKMIADQGEKKASKQREKDGARLVYSDDNWKVYEITTYEASKKYGANTKWCISGSKRWANGGNGTRFWNDYYENGIRFYFFINKDTKYALALYPDHKTFEIFDAQDNAISFIPNAPVIDEIKVDYFTKNDDRLLMSYIKSGQLPQICSIVTEYLWNVPVDITIFPKSEFQLFLDTVKENVNPDWVMWMAVDEGVVDRDDFEYQTGEDYREDYWGGDTTMYGVDDLNFYHDYATLEDALTKDNPAFKYDETEYFISDIHTGIIELCKDWVGVWMYIKEYIDDDELLEFTKSYARGNELVDDFEKLGLSRAYLLDESLQENLLEDKDTVEFLYHGSPSPTLNLERDSTLWLAEDYGYAIGYGEYLHICSAHLHNILEVGSTDGYIRGLIPTQFSPKFTEIANKLEMQPKALLRACGEDCKNIYSLIRTNQFRKICMEKGYDAVETEEFGNICYGVFNRHNVELIDTEDNRDEPTPMTESKLVDTKCDIEVKPIIREELLKH